MEKKKNKEFFYFIVFLVGTILYISILLITLEPVTDKLEATCKEYDMTYVFRDGQNCLDKNNVLHPIYSECPPPYMRGLCEIRFVK